MRSLFVALALASLSTGCIRHGSAGEACEAPGLVNPDTVGQCASGTVCTPDRSGHDGNGMSAHWDTATCRPTCTSNVDCTGANESCRPVDGAAPAMACQPN